MRFHIRDLIRDAEARQAYSAASSSEDDDMPQLSHAEETLIEKIRTLPPDKAAEVEDFVDFLRRRDDQRSLSAPAMKLSEAAFQRVWDNPEDAIYDQL